MCKVGRGAGGKSQASRAVASHWSNSNLIGNFGEGAAAAVFAKELFIHGQPFHTKNKRWKAYTCVWEQNTYPFRWQYCLWKSDLRRKIKSHEGSRKVRDRWSFEVRKGL
jgi:hypothetical protein